MDYNTCDKCQEMDASDALVWINAEDFTPLAGEIVPDEVCEKYTALCECCYLSLIVIKKKKGRK